MGTKIKNRYPHDSTSSYGPSSTYFPVTGIVEGATAPGMVQADSKPAHRYAPAMRQADRRT